MALNRAMLTFGVGTHEELLEIALPSFRRFAERHGYELLPSEPPVSDRPPSWWKVPMIKSALERYDEVLFLGADLVIVDDTDDIPFPPEMWQALVAHHTSEGEVPNADMWLLRPPMIPVLERMWKMTQWIQHGWWEQRALIELMGYEGPPMRITNPTELYRRTMFLDTGWNVHCHDLFRSERERIMHATMWPDRAGIMREWA